MEKILTFIFALVICFTLLGCATYTYDNNGAATPSLRF